MLRALLVVVVTLGALVAPASADDPGSSKELIQRWSIGYYAGYEADAYPVDAIDWSGMTDLAVSFYLVDGSGTLDHRLYQGTAGQGNDLATSLITAGHSNGARVVASVGGAGSGPAFHDAMTNHPATLVQSIVALQGLGYDGVDVDWEPLEPGDQALLAQLGTAIRAGWPGAVLSVPVEPINANFPPDLSGLDGVAAAFDRVDVMAYGMAYTYQGWKSWHSSALKGESGSTPTSVESSVQAYLDAGVPASQLGVGIGAYGLCFSAPVTGPRQKLRGSTILRDDYHLQYRQIRTTYQPAMRSHYDSAAEAPYLSGNKKHCTYITYETPRSIKAKIAWEADQGLGGVIMWTVNQQYLPSSGGNPLLATVGQEWLH
ncbi:glycoside hydrolase family 18 protein [Nocardioides panacisoli]|uniref:chitinase n=1 Tax=Nocardioides panacisoli TaxID=627624 RepID=A0ABP7IUG0_9ACTN